MLRRAKRNFEEEALLDNIKKVRLSISPGQLRFYKDIKCLEDMESVIFERSESSSVIVQFTNLPATCPMTFRISVAKYYPHDCPIVSCLNRGYNNAYIRPDGSVVHPDISASGWSAVRTLSDVLDTLKSIALMFDARYASLKECADECICLEDMEISKDA